jgi:hypothetical protein
MNEINVTPEAATFTPATDKLDYSVETVSLLTPEGEHSGWMANRRTDTKAVLGVCTERYTLVQNSSLIETVETAFADNKLGEFTRKAYVALWTLSVVLSRASRTAPASSAAWLNVPSNTIKGIPSSTT